MNRARVDRLAALVANLAQKRLGETMVPRAADELERAGFRVHRWENGEGLAVEIAPGLDRALAALNEKGIRPPLVVVIRNLAAEEYQTNQLRAEEDRPGGVEGEIPLPPRSAGPATSCASARVSHPPTQGSSDGE